MSKVYKVVSKLAHKKYHKLNGEYIDDGIVEETYEPTVHFENKEKALSECERILDKFLGSFYADGYISEKDKPEIKTLCMKNLKDKNRCVITKTYDNLVLKISEIFVS